MVYPCVFEYFFIIHFFIKSYDKFNIELLKNMYIVRRIATTAAAATAATVAAAVATAAATAPVAVFFFAASCAHCCSPNRRTTECQKLSWYYPTHIPIFEFLVVVIGRLVERRQTEPPQLQRMTQRGRQVPRSIPSQRIPINKYILTMQ